MEKIIAIGILVVLFSLLFIGSYLVSSSFRKKKQLQEQLEVATSASQ